MSTDQRNMQIDSSKKEIKFNMRDRMTVFVVLTAMNTLLNMDHGTIPAASNEIKEEYKINETVLGSFGSLVYFGALIGSLILSKFIDNVDRKLLSIISVLFNAFLIWGFIESSNISFIFANRIFVGITQSYITIYFPVWIDQFGPRKWKTIMLSIFNVTSPLGVIVGYILTMSVKTHFDVSLINYIFYSGKFLMEFKFFSCLVLLYA